MRAVSALVLLAVLVFSSAAWAQKVEGTAPAGTVPVVAIPGSGGTKTIIAQSPIMAAIGASGLVSIAGDLAVSGNLSGANVSATAGNVSASLDVIAGGNVKADPADGTVSGFFGDFEGVGGGVIGRDRTPTGGFVGVIGIADSND